MRTTVMPQPGRTLGMPFILGLLSFLTLSDDTKPGLLDDLIRPPQQRVRDRQAERLGSLEVDDELKLRRLLDGEVARFGALQDLIHEMRSTATHILEIFSVGHEAASVCEPPPPTNCG